ncbi:MAG TPA: hypothetical protein VJI70_01235 [Candidatus Paceibacterota bacterium]
MKEPYWERMMREKFSFLYPSEHIAADIGKGVVIGVVIVIIGLAVAISLVTWRDSFHNEQIVQSQQKCPDDYATHEEQLAALKEWTSYFYDKYPNASAGDWADARRDFFQQNDCKEALQRAEDYNSGNIDPTIKKIIDDAVDSASCRKNYEAGDNSPMKKLADFNNLYPLSDFLCGEDSNVIKMTFVDGKTLYFVAPIRMFDCGNGGCSYFSFLEEKPGLVRRIRGFDGYSVTVPYYDHTPIFHEDVEGVVFARILSFDSAKGTISVYDEIGDCGITNTYKVRTDGTPVLINAHDSCLKTTLFKL